MKIGTIVEHGGFNWMRVNKKTAKRCFDLGKALLACPVNWDIKTAVTMSKNNACGVGFYEDVTTIYDCAYYGEKNKGGYLAFYIPVKLADKWTHEEPNESTVETAFVYDNSAFVTWSTVWSERTVSK